MEKDHPEKTCWFALHSFFQNKIKEVEIYIQNSRQPVSMVTWLLLQIITTLAQYKQGVSLSGTFNWKYFSENLRICFRVWHMNWIEWECTFCFDYKLFLLRVSWSNLVKKSNYMAFISIIIYFDFFTLFNIICHFWFIILIINHFRSLLPI